MTDDFTGLMKELAVYVGEKAPVLGTVLEGPAGIFAFHLIADAFKKSSPKDIVQTVVEDPKAADKLKEIENQNINALRIALRDRISARSMLKIGYIREFLIVILVILIVLNVIAIQEVVSVQLAHFLMFSCGALLAELRRVFTLYFGKD